MTLSKMIDLIAEVAAKRATQEGGSKEETPNAVPCTIPRIFVFVRRWIKSFRLSGCKPLPKSEILSSGGLLDDGDRWRGASAGLL